MSSANFSPKSSTGNGAPLKEKSRCAGERSTEKSEIKGGKKLTLKTKKLANIKKQLIKKNMIGQQKTQNDLIRAEQNKLDGTSCIKDLKIEFCNDSTDKNFFDKAVQNAQNQIKTVEFEQKNMNQHLKVGDKGEFWGSDSLGRDV